MPESAASPGPRWSKRVGRRLFDEESVHLDRFGSLLVLTIASVAALSLSDVDSISNDAARGIVSIILSTTTGVTLVLALRASGVIKRWRRLAEWSVVIAFAVSVLVLVLETTADVDSGLWQSDSPSILWVVIAIVSPAAVIRRLVRHPRVSAATMEGAIAAYLLIAIAFTYIFLYMDSVSDNGFFDGLSSAPVHDFMYFSLVSITTVGYGDLAPGGPFAQLMATSEAVIGQVYLVTFVAMLVGLLIQQRDHDVGDGDGDDRDDSIAVDPERTDEMP